MNIETNSQRIFRRLIPPNLNNEEFKTLDMLPGPNSKNISIQGYNFGFKAYLKGKKAFSYRCSNRSICSSIIHIPLESNYNENYELQDNNVKDTTFINQHSDRCEEKMNKKNQDTNSLPVEAYSSDVSVLEAYIKSFPLLEPKTVKAEMLSKKQKFTNSQILTKIQQIRNELFPRDKEKVFSPVYCCALDSSENSYNLFRCHSKLPIYSNKATKNSLFQEFVIFANKPMLKQLSCASQWFIDGTFRLPLKVLNRY